MDQDVSLTIPGAPPETLPQVQMIDVPPSVLEGTRQMAQIFHQSGLFKDTKSEAQAIVKILAGRELGLPPMESMQEIYIISTDRESKVVLSASLIAKKIKLSKKYDFEIIELNGDLKDGRCEIRFLRRIDQFQAPVEIGTSVFTMEDARKADLVKAGGGWVKYTRNMLFARALTNGRRWFCPDVASGYYTPDELGFEEDEDGKPVQGLGPRPRSLTVMQKAQALAPHLKGEENERLGALYANPMVTDAELDREMSMVMSAAHLAYQDGNIIELSADDPLHGG